MTIEPVRQHHRTFRAYHSAAKLWGLFLLNGVMIAVCLFCLFLPRWDAQLAGGAGLLFFGWTLFVIPRRLWQTATPVIVMDDLGIQTGTAIGVVIWDDISTFRIDSIHGTRFISIFVQDTEKYLGRLSAVGRKAAEANRYLGFSEITLNFVGLSPGLDEACRYLSERGYRVA